MTKQERINKIHAQAIILFEGNILAADQWVNEPAIPLGSKKPLDMVESDEEMNLALELMIALEYEVFV